MTFKNTTCKNCEKIFLSNEGRASFCSRSCEAEYRNNNPTLRNCLECGKEFFSNKSKFCSEECQMKNLRKRKPIRICAYCGKEFQSVKKTQKYCNQECVHKANGDRCRGIRKTEPHHFICKNCGKEYTTTYKDRNTFCSRECSFEYRRIESIRNKLLKQIKFLLKGLVALKKKELNKPYSTKHICPECGIEFIGHKSAKYCSKKCYKRAVKRERRHIERSGSIHNSNPITIQLLGERDHWVCGICGKKINPKAAHDYIENGASVDHIIPLSCGGQHNWSNVQIAHFNCNSKRSNTPIVKQLYLDFGGIN